MTVNSVLTGPTGTESLKGCISSVNPDLSYADAEKKFMAENRPSPLIYRQAGERAAVINGAAIRAEGGTVQTIV